MTIDEIPIPQIHLTNVIAQMPRGLVDNTLRLVFDCQTITPDQIASLIVMRAHKGYLVFSPYPVDELKSVEKPIEEAAKANKRVSNKPPTPSQRLRSAIMSYYSAVHAKGPFTDEDFNEFYEEEMDFLINKLSEFVRNNDERGFRWL